MLRSLLRSPALCRRPTAGGVSFVPQVLKGSTPPYFHAARPTVPCMGSVWGSSLFAVSGPVACAVRVAAPTAFGGLRPFSTATVEQVPIARKRNIAIIAHVDHGKTTLVDSLLRASNTKIAEEADRVMDSNDLEKERGITILSKCTSINYAPKGQEVHRINIVDTPGHADFGGEVERVLSMVDGVVLVVCAAEGPMTQTKYVLRKALERNLKPLVVINKADRPTTRLTQVEDEVFELFMGLEASDEQMDFPIAFASAKKGWATMDMTDVDEHGQVAVESMTPLLDTIVEYMPPPAVDADADFAMICSLLESDSHFGKALVGRIQAGSVKIGDTLKTINKNGNVERSKVSRIMARLGLEQIPVDSADAGDIVSVYGFGNSTVNDTLCHVDHTEPFDAPDIDPPTLAMRFGVNDSPLAGKSGTHCTSAAIQDYITRECTTNVSLQMEKVGGDACEVRGRGEMQLGVLLEQMRRAGFELGVSPPKVVFQTADGKPFLADPSKPLTRKETDGLLEPIEEVEIEVDAAHTGTVMEKMAKRNGVLESMNEVPGDRTRMCFRCPTRGMIGYRSEFVNDTRGNGIINSTFLEYADYTGPLERTLKGAIIATDDGLATAHALANAATRGTLFVETGMPVYRGMVVGENSRVQDMDVNVAKLKALSNVRTVLKDEKIRLPAAKLMNIEEMIAYVREDEIIEVTPDAVRLRKVELDPKVRQRNARNAKKA